MIHELAKIRGQTWEFRQRSSLSVTSIMATGHWHNPIDADVILRVGGSREFHAHKFVLSLASSVFKDMFSAPLLSAELSATAKLPVIDVHDSPEALEMFLQIIYPVRNPQINNLETLVSVLKLADKYDASALDTLKDSLPWACIDSPPIHLYALHSACGRKKEAEAVARRIPLASLDSLPGFLLQLMTVENYHQLVRFVISRSKKTQDIARRYKEDLAAKVRRTGIDDTLHASYPNAIVSILQAAFEADPCVRTTEALGLVLNSLAPHPRCEFYCIFQARKLQEIAEELLGELVRMGETHPWEGRDE